MNGISAGQSIQHVMSSGPLWVDEHTTLRSIAALLTDARIGAVIVRRDDGSAGIVSERDIVRSLAGGAHPDEVSAAQVMSTPLLTAAVDERIGDVAVRMATEDVRHIALVDRDAIVGVVSARDLLRILADEVVSTW